MAGRMGREDGFDYGRMQPVRASSFSSDIMSASGRSAGAAFHVPYANPPPAYVAQAEASKILTKELDRRIIVSQAALTLLNEFLDHVLYNIILASQSVALYPLRSALPSVLKPRLGKLALKAGEEELREYMEEEQVQDELYSNRYAVIAKSGFDAELVWKLARLRCMVYTRMGDVEEEDEEEWLDKERLLDQVARSPAEARQFMAVSPNAAIFLAAILEHLGEQALYYAAQYAQKRHDNIPVDMVPASQIAARDADIILDGKDMNHVGRDSPLSRLWRSWRRNTRSPSESASRPLSPDNMLPPPTDGTQSRTTSNIPPIAEENGLHEGESNLLTPAHIPLPQSDGDIADIEGLDDTNDENRPRRPTSMPSMPGRFPTDISVHDGPAPAFEERSPLRPGFARLRSNSVPIPKYPFDNKLPQDNSDFALPIQGTTQEEDGAERAPTSEQENSGRKASLVTTESPEHPAILEQQSQKSTDRPKTPRTPSPEELNTTVGVLAGALGAVGLHHVGKEALQIKANEPYATSPSNADQPLTSASIKGLNDFNMMYVPGAEPSSAQKVDSAPSRNKLSPIATNPKDPYREIRLQQYEEHKRYSQQSHTMDTPSIYSHREHSPRFPTDMRRNSTPAEEAERASEVIATSYAPTPEPDFYSPVPGSVPANQVIYADSPVSASSSKFSRNQLPITLEPTPEVPSLPKATEHNENGINGRDRGHSTSSSSSSRLLGFTRDSAGRPYTIHQQKAAGDMSNDVRRAHTSTPTSMSKARPGTADSQTPPKRQQFRLRDESENNVIKPTVTSDRPKRSLEDMIKSDETLHYTLTPATATFREEKIASSPKRYQKQDLAEFFRTTSPPGQENATPKPMIKSRKVSLDARRAPQPVSGQRERKIIRTSQYVSQVPDTPKSRNPVGEPRDAKVDNTSGVRDLADYVRSTGPSTDDQFPRPLTTRPGPGSSTMARATMATVVSSPSPKSTRKLSSRLQARDARPSRRAESSALIDFIREGPPRQAGDHRINRNVAPFRTTMDSDELNGLVSQLPRDSKHSSEITGVPSIATTNNSNTPLFNNSATMGTAQWAPVRAAMSPESDDEMPKGTRRRVKDPYAIDDSDDDELFEATTPKQTNEESLIDFLRNTAPTPNMVAQPILSTPQQAQQAQQAIVAGRSTLNQAPSIDKLRDFVRGGRSTPAPSTANTQPYSPTSARAESPHLTQAGTKLDSYRPTQVTHAAHVERNRRGTTQTRADSPMSATTDDIKGGGAGYGATADLAEYLRHTGPPPTSQAEVQPFILTKTPVNGLKKEEGGLKKFFSMRGKR